jgi:hypothetical protein
MQNADESVIGSGFGMGEDETRRIFFGNLAEDVGFQ